MKEVLRVSIIQSVLHWENSAANREHFSRKIGELPQTDLVVLPEMFTTGFSMNSELLAEETAGSTLSWMKETAQLKGTAITGSLIVTEAGNFFNRLYFVFPDGNVSSYDKRHLFSFANEHKSFSAGSERLIIEYKGWKICPLICYDLRFPIWSRNAENYDLLLYVANWPKARISTWDTLLKARAIENLCYVVGVNRVGIDGNELSYVGHSAVYDMFGNQISTKKNTKEFLETLIISRSELINMRKKFPFLKDQDKFELKV